MGVPYFTSGQIGCGRWSELGLQNILCLIDEFAQERSCITGVNDIRTGCLRCPEGRGNGLQATFHLFTLRLGIGGRLDLTPIGCKCAAFNVHGTPAAGWPGIAPEHPCGPVLALPGNTIDLTHDEGDPWHFAAADGADQSGAGPFDPLFLRFNTNHEPGLIGKGYDRQVKRIAEL